MGWIPSCINHLRPNQDIRLLGSSQRCRCYSKLKTISAFPYQCPPDVHAWHLIRKKNATLAKATKELEKINAGISETQAGLVEAEKGREATVRFHFRLLHHVLWELYQIKLILSPHLRANICRKNAVPFWLHSSKKNKFPLNWKPSWLLSELLIQLDIKRRARRWKSARMQL